MTTGLILLVDDTTPPINTVRDRFGMLPLSFRKDLQFCFMLHKSSFDLDTGTLNTFTVPKIYVTGQTLRSTESKDMKVPNYRSNLGHQSFSFRGPSTWKKLQALILFGDHPTSKCENWFCMVLCVFYTS